MMTVFSSDNASAHHQRMLVCVLLGVASLGLLGVARDNKDNGLVLVEQRRFLQSSHGVCHLPVPNDPCHTDASYQQCMDLEAQNCNVIAASRACPPRYVCMDTPVVQPVAEYNLPATLPANNPDEPPVMYTYPSAALASNSQEDLPILVSATDREGKCQLPDEDCTTEESYQECLGFVEAGCNMILSTFSCPPKFRCGDGPSTITRISMSDSDSIDDMICFAPAEFNCETAESYSTCRTLVGNGCEMVASSRSCPPQYECRNSPN